MTDKSKVVLTRCASYGPDVQRAVDELLAGLGGIGAFVKPGQSVLIKPNLLTARSPEQAVTTHPEVVRALIRTLKKHGAAPTIADSPSSVIKIEELWSKTGFSAMCQEENVPLLNLEKSGSVARSANGFSFTIAKPVADADVVINVPKVKTHVLTILTCAVKNMYGTVPGFQKATLHKLNPTPRRFGQLVAAIYACNKPRLSIADGVIGMEGDGPSAGRAVQLGFLAASADGVALDTVLCRVLGIDTKAVPYFERLGKSGVGETNFDRIEVAGASVKELAPASFKVPSTVTGRLIPGWLVDFLEPYLWIRPHFTNRCIFCGLCVKSCPVSALSIQPKQKPSLDPAKCIGCCCCHEVCPVKAIEMTQSPFLTFIRGGKTS